MNTLDVSLDKMNNISDDDNITDETAATNKDNELSVCANCGKEGSSDNMNTCNKCKMVKYCNAACKKKHRSKHKKQCERQVAEIHDEQLFKQPPPLEDCPICFMQLPYLDPTGKKYMTCCGKTVCSGCVYAPVYDDQGNKVDENEKKCPFCRTPHPKSDKEINEMYKKRMELDDPIAIYTIGNFYRDGRNGYPQDIDKALELYHRAAELGCSEAYCNIGNAYYHGEGVEIDEKKATYYYEQAAIKGNASARHNLGNNEIRAGNMDRALKHYMIGIGAGYAETLDMIKQMYSKGCATKEDYTTALQHFKITWVRLRVFRGMKLLQLMRIIVTISLVVFKLTYNRIVTVA